MTFTIKMTLEVLLEVTDHRAGGASRGTWVPPLGAALLQIQECCPPTGAMKMLWGWGSW